jgi:DNA-binding response OmpR family regulator
MPEKILVVDDELTLQETLPYNLLRQGYEVETVGDGIAAVEAARHLQPDLIVLDLMLPGIDGFEVCRILRQEMIVTILMLTARDDEMDRVIGLEMGADDYVTKPFSMRELIARIKAHLRRTHLLREEFDIKASAEIRTFRFGNLFFDMTRHEVLMDDRPLALKPKEFDLLIFLARHQGQAISRKMILERVWGWDFSGGSRTVDVHTRWLREKIEIDPNRPTRLVTVRGAGYRFEG